MKKLKLYETILQLKNLDMEKYLKLNTDIQLYLFLMFYLWMAIFITFFELFLILISYNIAGNEKLGRVWAIDLFNVALEIVLLAI